MDVVIWTLVFAYALVATELALRAHMRWWTAEQSSGPGLLVELAEAVAWGPMAACAALRRAGGGS